MIALENFDDGTETAPDQSADYKRGFADAQVEAANAEKATLTLAVAELSATLKDMTFGYEEARLALLERMGPLLSQVADLIVPEVLQTTFGHHLFQVLYDAVQDAGSDPVRIGVHPETRALLLTENLDVPPQFSLVDDTSLAKGQAAILFNGQGALLDLTSLSNDLKTALSAIEPPERSSDHG